MNAVGTRPEHDIGEILRNWGPEYSRTHAMTSAQRRVMRVLSECRTSALGGHLEECEACGYERPVYNSCGDRHCPTCQGQLAREWLAARLEDVLDTAYFHTIFTLPDEFNGLVAYNSAALYDLLFRAASAALRHLARRRLKVELGIVAVLHTWGQALWLHPHLHCIVTGGGLSRDRTRWVSTGAEFLFDVVELSNEFRRRFCRLLLARSGLVFGGDAAALAPRPAFEAFVEEQARRPWVVFVKKPVRGPRQVLEYLSRYTHRVAISNRRILDVSADGQVTFQYQDWRDRDWRERPRQKTMTLSAVEFIGRFLRHVLPCGFRKIRFYGLLAGCERGAKLAAARALLGTVDAPAPADVAAVLPPCADDPRRCPSCGAGPLRPVRRLYPVAAPPVVWPYRPGRHADAA